MHITFSPSRSDATLSLSKQGDVLTINDETLDFTALPDGATLPADAVASNWVVGPVERIDGVINIKIVLPYPPIPPEHAASAQAVTFPDPITATDGVIAVPTWSAPS